MGFYYLGNCSAVVDCCKIVSILFLVSYPSDIHVENWLHLDEFHDSDVSLSETELQALYVHILVLIGFGNDGPPLIACAQFLQMGQLWHCILCP